MSQYLTFILDEENYGIDISSVIEIIGIQKIVQVPQQPEYTKGVINLRGRIIPTVDVRIRFNKEKVDYDERTCIIVVDVKETMVGFIVDRVDEVMTISDESISQPPNFNQDFKGKYVKGIAKTESEIIILLESGLLLSSQELKETEFLHERKKDNS
ncbi:MAG: chemotaxis protein CheW [Clostridia bacterium]|nr:chemotaxis protein CheW [Clostridia bacterium]